MIQCPRCSKLFATDAGQHVPPWCPHCGTDLTSAVAIPDTPAAVSQDNGATSDIPREVPKAAHRPAVDRGDGVLARRPESELPLLPPPSTDRSAIRSVLIAVAVIAGLIT